MRRRREMRAAVGGLVATVVALLGPSLAEAASDQDRYTLANGCFALYSEAGDAYVRKAGAGYRATAAGPGGAEPFTIRPTTLGRYLLFDSDGRFLSFARGSLPLVSSDSIIAASKPSNAADWTIRKPGSFTIANRFVNKDLGVSGSGELIPTRPGSGSRFGFVETSGCRPYPEISTNVSGRPSKGFPRFGETSGFVEGHMHHMAFRFLGGAHCGRPWHRFGVSAALVDCVDHEPNGCAAVLENALYGEPARCHDTTGWPDFTDWPDPESLTHEQSYYRWLERAHQSGLRIFVNLMVQNRALCEIYPINPENNECDDTKTVDIELDEAYALQDYIDAQAGGPGKGFYRIVRNPFAAREVINEGKLAVVLGMEVSEPFTCRMFNGVPSCDEETITEQIDHLYKRGVRQMEITNKFDNALTGVAGDDGEIGALVNAGNFYVTGRFWDLEKCTTEDPEHEHDKSPTGIQHNDDLILANAFRQFLPAGVAPVYPQPPLCNTRGLTELGAHAIREIAKRGMIFDPDHQSVKGRDAAMRLIESLGHSGVISSHSWSTRGTLPRIYAAGGIVTPYAGDSETFVERWKEAKLAFRGRQYWGIGYGADQNGFGSQGGPRGGDVSNPVTYPFESFDGKQTIGKQVSGNRTYDINRDGVAHYGLYPDWIEDLRRLAGEGIVRDLGRGSEAYLQMWERSVGVPKVSCEGWRGSFYRRGLRRSMRLGDGAEATLMRAGQPLTRSRRWQWCTRSGGGDGRELGKRRRLTAVFDTGGRLRMSLSTLRRNSAGGIERGDRRRKVERRADRVAKGLYARELGNGNVYVYRVRRNRVRVTGVADQSIAAPRQLRRYFRRSGLR